MRLPKAFTSGDVPFCAAMAPALISAMLPCAAFVAKSLSPSLSVLAVPPVEPVPVTVPVVSVPPVVPYDVVVSVVSVFLQPMATMSIAAATRIRKRLFMTCKLLSRPVEQETLQRRDGLSQSPVLVELVVELRRDAQHALRPLRPRLH